MKNTKFEMMHTPVLKTSTVVSLRLLMQGKIAKKCQKHLSSNLLLLKVCNSEVSSSFNTTILSHELSHAAVHSILVHT